MALNVVEKKTEGRALWNVLHRRTPQCGRIGETVQAVSSPLPSPMNL